jgi:hypothetical protein
LVIIEAAAIGPLSSIPMPPVAALLAAHRIFPAPNITVSFHSICRFVKLLR